MWLAILIKTASKTVARSRGRTRIQQEHSYSGVSVSLAWRLDGEMSRRLILHETGFTHYRFFTPYFWIFTFYLFLNWVSTHVIRLLSQAIRVYKYTKNSRALIPEKLHHCQRSKKGFSWHVISIITKNRPHAHHKSHLHTMKVYNTQPVSLLLIKFSFFSTTEAFTCSKVINAFKR